MKTLMLSLILAAALDAPALAQQKAEDHAAHHPAATSATDVTEGEIRKVDKEAAKITIRHGEIKNLDMPPMTMVFQVREPALLDKVKTGDKVRFKVEKAGTAFVVIAIEAIR